MRDEVESKGRGVGVEGIWPSLPHRALKQSLQILDLTPYPGSVLQSNVTL